jgi:capsule biosynthesis phosphatase
MKRIVIDLDGTLTVDSDLPYAEKEANKDVIKRLYEYKKMGFEIVIFSSRNMRTHSGNLGLINIHTLPLMLEWLNKHDIPYDEVLVGKPWCGHEGFYVDNRSVRPGEFVSLDYEDVLDLIK